MIDTINTIMSLALALLSGWAVMSQRVRDGVVIKAGLICIALGFGAASLVTLNASGPDALAAAHALVHIGLLICGVGYLLRKRMHKRRGIKGLHRLSDWVDLA